MRPFLTVYFYTPQNWFLRTQLGYVGQDSNLSCVILQSPNLDPVNFNFSAVCL